MDALPRMVGIALLRVVGMRSCASGVVRGRDCAPARPGLRRPEILIRATPDAQERSPYHAQERIPTKSKT
jgi:hypothetical protein